MFNIIYNMFNLFSTYKVVCLLEFTKKKYFLNIKYSFISLQSFILFIKFFSNHHFSFFYYFTNLQISNYTKEFTKVYMHI